MTVFPKLNIVETDATLAQWEQIMKYAAFLRIMLLTAAGFTLLAGRRAPALNTLPEERTTTAG